MVYVSALARFGSLWLVGLCLSVNVFGQAHYQHNVVWGRLALTDTINSRLRWELYIQGRLQNREVGSLNAFTAPQFVSYWPWLTYSIRPTLRVGLSPVGYFKSWLLIADPSEAERQPIREWRIALRLDQEQRFRRFSYTNRYSLERRWRDLANNGLFLPNWRVRYQARLDVPIRANWVKYGFTVSVSDELFLQFGEAVRANPNIFDQNRLYGGITYGLSKSVRASIGYINQIQQRNSGKEFDHAHVLFGVLTIDNLLAPLRRWRRAGKSQPPINGSIPE
ncbi:DUF2490 domain-containing protein [Fibrella sp. WM1]|uniref:DUF2490 domain-containing protein n=1 Tax=Fibrella musci TaxID=3242485 RepID=UPI003522E579